MPISVWRKLFIRASFLTLGMIVVWAGLDAVFTGTIWQGMTISKSALTVEYCEFNHVDRFFRQPMNTYSNLAYFFFGLLILQIAVTDYKNRHVANLSRLEKFPLLSAFTGLCFIYLSFGSAFFHASLTYIGQRVDMNGTYGITIALLGVAMYQTLYTIKLTTFQKKIWVLCLAAIMLLFLKVALLIPSATLVPGLILLLNVFIVINYSQFRKERSAVLAVTSLLLLIVAVKIRTLDVQKVGCDPHSVIQGHSIWHLLTALSSFCSYAFFRFRKNSFVI